MAEAGSCSISPRQVRAHAPNRFLGATLGLAVFLCGAPNTWGDDFEFARGAFEKKRYEIAARNFTRVLEETKDARTAAESRYYLAMCYVQLDRAPEALPILLPMVDRQRDDFDWLDESQQASARYQVGRILLIQGPWPEARTRMQAYLDQHPADRLASLARYELADAALRQNDLETAARTLEQSTNPDPAVAPYLLHAQAKLAQMQGNLDEARQRFRVSIEQASAEPAKPDLLADAFFRLGQMDYQQGRFAESARLLAEGRQRIGDHPSAYLLTYQEGLAHVALGDSAKADEIFQSLLTTNPTHPLSAQLWYQRARLARATGNLAVLDQAVAELSRLPAQGTWRDRSQVLLAEALLAGAGAQPMENVGRIREFFQSATDAESRERLGYLLGLALFQQEDLPAAEQQLRPLLSASEESVRLDAGYVLGLVRLRQGEALEAANLIEPFTAQSASSANTVAALRSLVTALAPLPKDDATAGRIKKALDRASACDNAAPLLVDMAETLYQQNQWDLAADAFERARAQQSTPETHKRAVLGLAWCRFKRDEVAPALELFAEASTAPTATPAEQAESLYMLGVLSASAGESDRALRVWARVMDEHPDSPFANDAFRRGAHLLEQQQQFERADGVLARLAERLPAGAERALVHRDRARLALRAGDQTKAAEQYEAAMSEPDPGLAGIEAALKRSEFVQAAGDLEGALALVQSAGKMNPEGEWRAAYLVRLGTTLRALGRPAEAAQALDQLLAELPTSNQRWPALFLRGELADELDKPDDARSSFQKLADEAKGDRYESLARWRLAQLDARAGRWAEAEAEANRLHASAQEDSLKDEAIYIRGQVAQARGQFDQARELFQSVIGETRTETAAKAQFMIGETYFLQEDFERAIEEFLKVEILYALPPWQARSLVEMAKCHVRRAEMAEAKEALADVLKRYPTTPAAKEAETELERISAANTASGR